MAVRLTQNFTLEEFTKSDTAITKKINNTPNATVIDNIKRLANYLQGIRNCYAKPINISSGYRCYELNKVIGGAKNSQHVSGEAADINTGSKAENKKLFELIRKSGGFDQLINESDFSWVHVSHRAGKNRKEVLKMINGKYYKM